MRKLNWPFVFAFFLMHAAAAAAFWHFSWSGLIVGLVLFILSGWIGIGLCYHRLLAHASLKVPKGLEYALAVLGALAFQGGPIMWVGTHRRHHKYSDRQGDPHSPKGRGGALKGFLWSHLLWMCRTGQRPHREHAPAWMKHSRFYRFIDRGHVPLQAALAAVLLAIGGWSWALFGVFLRIVCLWHATFAVNSATHLWGYRNFETDDDSKNNWIVAVVSGGEGWHNNHHHAPRVATTKVRWWEFDFTGRVILILKGVGLATEVFLTRPEASKTVARPLAM